MVTKDQILYFFDPLCGWCFGFSHIMQDFYRQHHRELDFQAIPGGMITGSRVAPYRTMESYIKSVRSRLEATTGSKLGNAYLDQIVASDTPMNSEPPGRALITFRHFLPRHTLAYAHALQLQHFMNGRDYNDDAVYGELAAEFGVDQERFMEKFEEEQLKLETNREFAWVNSAGIKGFPTVLLRSGDQHYLITHGYSDLRTLNEVLQKAHQRAGAS